jgi:hypothetical protein
MNNDGIGKAINAIREAEKNITEALDKPGFTRRKVACPQSLDHLQS